MHTHKQTHIHKTTIMTNKHNTTTGQTKTHTQQQHTNKQNNQIYKNKTQQNKQDITTQNNGLYFHIFTAKQNKIKSHIKSQSKQIND